MAENAIEIAGLKKDFGEVEALKGINLSIEAGQIYGFLGPNGAGKTTLIRTLIGATKATAGKVSVLGFDPQKEKKALRRLIGYMPQSPALYEDMSPMENVQFFGGAHGQKEIKKRVEKVLKFVDLKEREKDLVHTFSGGMKQRTSLACALVNQPRMLFLDEPTSGVDPELRESFWKNFREWADKGVTILISTHQLDESMYCDKLAILHNGTILANDSPKNLLWKKEAEIKIWKKERAFKKTIENYPERLPILLQKLGLNKSISRIEINETSLETVILDLINEKVGEGLGV